MMASTRPPMVLVGISPKADTHKNMIETSEFVVSIPQTDIEKSGYLIRRNSE